MDQLTAKQSNLVANQFLVLAQSIGDFRYRHWPELSEEQHIILARQHYTLLHYGEDILARSTILIMVDAEESIAAIVGITSRVKTTIGTLTDIQRGINLVTDIVSMAAAIVSGNPSAIGSGFESILKSLTKFS